MYSLYKPGHSPPRDLCIYYVLTPVTPHRADSDTIPDAGRIASTLPSVVRPATRIGSMSGIIHVISVTVP